MITLEIAFGSLKLHYPSVMSLLGATDHGSSLVLDTSHGGKGTCDCVMEEVIDEVSEDVVRSGGNLWVTVVRGRELRMSKINKWKETRLCSFETDSIQALPEVAERSRPHRYPMIDDHQKVNQHAQAAPHHRSGLEETRPLWPA